MAGDHQVRPTGFGTLALPAKLLTELPHARNPADKEAAGPAELGEIGASDAG